MTSEGWYDGTWNDWRWKTPDHRSSSSSSIPQPGWTLRFGQTRDGDSAISLVETTSSDPQWCGDERGEVIPSLDEVVAWWEAGLLDPREGETEEPCHAGRWRRQKWPGEPQAAVEKEVEEENIDGYKLQRVAIPQAGSVQGAVPLHQRKQGEANEVSADELEAEDQKAVASTIILTQREQKLPCAQGGQRAR